MSLHWSWVKFKIKNFLKDEKLVMILLIINDSYSQILLIQILSC